MVKETQEDKISKTAAADAPVDEKKPVVVEDTPESVRKMRERTQKSLDEQAEGRKNLSSKK